SPLIATVLIIGLVVVISVGVFVWGRGWVGNLQQTSEERAEAQITCTTKVALDVKKACTFGGKVKLQIENADRQKITSFLFRIEGTRGASLFPSTKSLSQAGIEFFDATYSADTYGGIGDPKRIEIFPQITIGGKEVPCSPVTEEINPCYPLPEIGKETVDWSGNFEIMPNEGVYPSNSQYSIVVRGGEARSKDFVVPQINVREGVSNLHVLANVDGNGVIKLVDASTNEPLFSTTTTTILANGGTNDVTIPLAGQNGENSIEGKTVYFSIKSEESGRLALSEFCYTPNDVC
ncbi:hypothetical protein HY643_04705, partial [Candidatus Woesearchaeota archaeon]|nr:hypothetical protein [Candidatus Woesearchaeota archaeon]